MTLGMITVVILAVSAALCTVATVSFYRSNVFNDKRKNYLILTMGIAATMWNVSLIGYSISTKAAFYNGFFYLLILAFDMERLESFCRLGTGSFLGWHRSTNILPFMEERRIIRACHRWSIIIIFISCFIWCSGCCWCGSVLKECR